MAKKTVTLGDKCTKHVTGKQAFTLPCSVISDVDGKKLHAIEKKFLGKSVVLARIPTWAPRMPVQTQLIVAHCVGRAYRVVEVTTDLLLVLDVSRDVDRRFGGYKNDLRVDIGDVRLLVAQEVHGDPGPVSGLTVVPTEENGARGGPGDR